MVIVVVAVFRSDGSLDQIVGLAKVQPSDLL